MSKSSKSPQLSPSISKIDRFIFGCVILASMTSILSGLDDSLEDDKVVTTFLINHNKKMENIFVYAIILTCFNPLASFAAGGPSDWFGRRYTLMFSLIIFFFGSLTTVVAQNFAIFLFGRLLVSAGVGFAHTATSLYITELSPASTRGFLTSFIEVFFNVGALLGNILAYSLSKVLESPREQVILGFGTILSLLLVASVTLALPESPSWLVTRGKLDEAKQVFTKMSYGEEEMSLLISQIKNEAASRIKWWRRTGWKMILLHPSPFVRRSLIAVVGVNFFRNSIVKDFIQSYCQNLLVQVWKINERDMLLGTIAIGLIQIGVTLISGILMDRVGRRPLLLVSIIGAILSLAGLGLGLKIIGYQHKPIWAVTLSMIMFLSYKVFLSIGLNPITPVYSSEIFPLNLRAQGASLGSGVGWFTRVAIFWIYPLLLESYINMTSLFLISAGVTVVGLLFFYHLVPETLNKSLWMENDIVVSQPTAIEKTTYLNKMSKSITFPMTTLLSRNFNLLMGSHGTTSAENV